MSKEGQEIGFEPSVRSVGKRENIFKKTVPNVFSIFCFLLCHVCLDELDSPLGDLFLFGQCDKQLDPGDPEWPGLVLQDQEKGLVQMTDGGPRNQGITEKTWDQKKSEKMLDK